MNSEKFSAALGEIDVSYVEDVIHYKAVHKYRKQIWKMAAACAAVIVLLIGIIPLLHRWNMGNTAEEPNVQSNGFVLVAYASEGDVVVEHPLQKGKYVPVSFFETKNGLKGFVFAYNKNSPNEISSISIMTEGEFPNIVEEIIGLTISKDKHYTFYIPSQEKEFPYSFMIPYTDEAANKVYSCYLLVEETETGYSAVIERIEEFERTLKE